MWLKALNKEVPELSPKVAQILLVDIKGEPTSIQEIVTHSLLHQLAGHSEAALSLLEKAAEHLQDPFENRPTDVPVSSISRNIEINILTLLEEKEIPEKFLERAKRQRAEMIELAAEHDEELMDHYIQ